MYYLLLTRNPMKNSKARIAEIFVVEGCFDYERAHAGSDYEFFNVKKGPSVLRERRFLLSSGLDAIKATNEYFPLFDGNYLFTSKEEACACAARFVSMWRKDFLERANDFHGRFIIEENITTTNVIEEDVFNIV